MLQLGVRVCYLIVALNTFHDTNTLPPYKVQNVINQKRPLPENYQVLFIGMLTCDYFVNDCIKMEEVEKNF